MNTKFYGLLDRLFNRIEKDSEKTEQAIADIRESLHKNELDIKKIAVFPKKTCTFRFEKIESKAEEIERRLPNDRELKKAEIEEKEIKQAVKKNSKTLLKIVMYASAIVTVVVVVAGIYSKLMG